jgi:hypothetical protein
MVLLHHYTAIILYYTVLRILLYVQYTALRTSLQKYFRDVYALCCTYVWTIGARYAPVRRRNRTEEEERNGMEELEHVCVL